MMINNVENGILTSILPVLIIIKSYLVSVRQNVSPRIVQINGYTIVMPSGS
jgi:hypothetical protein